MIEVSSLSNGIHVISDYQDSTAVSAVGIWLLNGSRHQNGDQNGYAHFLEHLLFKGTHTHSAKQLADAFETMGGQINAQTGRELTGLYGTVPNANVEALLSLLGAMLMQPCFNTQDVNVEKEIVLQEMAMVKDDPEEVLVETTTSKVWPNHPMGWPILGKEETILSATEQGLHAYLKNILQGKRLWVVSAGGTSHEKLLKACRPLEQIPQGEPPQASTPRYTQAHHALRYGIAQSCLQWDMPAVHYTHPEFLAFMLSNHLLGGGGNSRLFQEVREKRGLVYNIQSHLEIYSDCGLWSIQTACEPENKQDCFNAIEQCCQKLIDEKPSQHEMNIIRQHIKASLILEAHNLEANMERLAREAIYLKQIDSLETRLKKIDRIAREDVARVFEHSWSQRAYGELTPEETRN